MASTRALVCKLAVLTTAALLFFETRSGLVWRGHSSRQACKYLFRRLSSEGTSPMDRGCLLFPHWGRLADSFFGALPLSGRGLQHAARSAYIVLAACIHTHLVLDPHSTLVVASLITSPCPALAKIKHLFLHAKVHPASEHLPTLPLTVALSDLQTVINARKPPPSPIVVPLLTSSRLISLGSLAPTANIKPRHLNSEGASTVGITGPRPGCSLHDRAWSIIPTGNRFNRTSLMPLGCPPSS